MTNNEARQLIRETLAAQRSSLQAAAVRAQAEKCGELYQVLSEALEDYTAPDVVWMLGIVLEDYCHGMREQGVSDPIMLSTAQAIQAAHVADAAKRAEVGSDALQLRTWRLAVVAMQILAPRAAVELARTLAGCHPDDLDQATVEASITRRRDHFGLGIDSDDVSALAAALLQVPV